MPVRRLTPEEADARKTDFEQFADRLAPRPQAHVVGYLYRTEEKDKFKGYLDLHGKRYNIFAVPMPDPISRKVGLQVEFLDDEWLAAGGQQHMIVVYRKGKTWGSAVQVPGDLCPTFVDPWVNLSFHLNYPPAPQLRGRQPFAWKVTQRKRG